jgi:hypothetical protein
VAAIISIASCSAERQRREEPIAKTSQATHVEGHAGIARKVCQLVGDVDFETGLPTNAVMRKVEGLDLGYPVAQGNRLWFFFGDQGLQPGQSVGGALDPLGYAEGPFTPGACPRVQFEDFENGTNDALLGSSVRLDGAFLGEKNVVFSVPTGVTFDEAGDRFIGHFSINKTKLGPGVEPSFADNVGVIGFASRSAPNRFFSLPVASGVTSQFIFAAPVIVSEDQVREIPLPNAGAGSQGKVLLVWGSGPARASGVFLAAVRLEQMEMRSKWLVFGEDGRWGGAGTPLKSVFVPEVRSDGNRGCTGELSVSYNQLWKRWMMVYTCAEEFPQGRRALGGYVSLRTAPSPLGPWSPPRTLFHPTKDNVPPDADIGFGRLLHRANPRGYDVCDRFLNKEFFFLSFLSTGTTAAAHLEY